MTYVLVADVAVYLSPIDYAAVETHRLSGKVLGWQWVRMFSPVVNLYAVVFLIGGAVLSALRYSTRTVHAPPHVGQRAHRGRAPSCRASAARRREWGTSRCCTSPNWWACC